MSFFALVVKNLMRQPVRAGLALLGIAIGITTVVALGVITDGLKQTSAEIITIGGADFMVAQEGTSDLSFSAIPEEDVAALGLVEGVGQAWGVVFHIAKVGSNPFFVLLGARGEALAANGPLMREGRTVAPGATDEIVLGAGGAKNLDAAVGDRVSLSDHEFTVVGIYQTGRLWEDNGAYADLGIVQELASKPGIVTVAYVKVEAGAARQDVADRVMEKLPTLAVIQDIGDYERVDQGIQMLDAANLAISLLAVGIGAIGVMNTMVMSVFERTREIGILRAVGWSGWRVIRMVVLESILLCIVAAVLGAALGIAASRAVMLVPTISNFLEPQYSVAVFVRALGVAVIVALLGAAYPAIRAVRLTPMEALRYE